jgi:hypothetical protein
VETKETQHHLTDLREFEEYTIWVSAFNRYLSSRVISSNLSKEIQHHLTDLREFDEYTIWVSAFNRYGYTNKLGNFVAFFRGDVFLYAQHHLREFEE